MGILAVPHDDLHGRSVGFRLTILSRLALATSGLPAHALRRLTRHILSLRNFHVHLEYDCTAYVNLPLFAPESMNTTACSALP
jgi:hypothetical protein